MTWNAFLFEVTEWLKMPTRNTAYIFVVKDPRKELSENKGHWKDQQLWEERTREKLHIPEYKF